MNVSDAVLSRLSCRAFLDRPVREETVRALLDVARWAPSGGNLQPWHVHVLTGRALADLVDRVTPRLHLLPKGEGGEYDVYPPELPDPYAARRHACGQALYTALGIPRGDRAARYRNYARNFAFFGAPVGLFFSIDRAMGPPQWSDLGMFIQTVMLLARERGLHSCAQEAWTYWHRTVAEFLDLPAKQMVFCGMALGYMDEGHPANRFRTERAQVGEFASFKGFATEDPELQGAE